MAEVEVDGMTTSHTHTPDDSLVPSPIPPRLEPTAHGHKDTIEYAAMSMSMSISTSTDDFTEHQPATSPMSPSGMSIRDSFASWHPSSLQAPYFVARSCVDQLDRRGGERPPDAADEEMRGARPLLGPGQDTLPARRSDSHGPILYL
ncbi:unnamed protein product [Diplocarpon coronariae]